MSRINEAQLAASSGLGVIPIIMIGAGTIVLTLALMALSFGGSTDPATPVNIDLPLPLVIHLATVIPALPLGAYVLIRRKGDALHKLLGRIWAMMMVTTAIAALGLGDGWSFIHQFSFMTLFSVPFAIWRIRQGDIFGHRRALEGVYIGLVVAGAFTFIPGRLFGTLLFG